MPQLHLRRPSLVAVSRLSLLPLIALAWALNGCGGGGAVPPSTTTVNIDFSQPIAAKSMVGFLHSMSSNGPPELAHHAAPA